MLFWSLTVSPLNTKVLDQLTFKQIYLYFHFAKASQIKLELIFCWEIQSFRHDVFELTITFTVSINFLEHFLCSGWHVRLSTI